MLFAHFISIIILIGSIFLAAYTDYYYRALGEGSGGYSDGDQQSNEDFNKVKMNIDLSMEISGEANQISKSQRNKLERRFTDLLKDEFPGLKNVTLVDITQVAAGSRRRRGEREAVGIFRVDWLLVFDVKHVYRDAIDDFDADAFVTDPDEIIQQHLQDESFVSDLDEKLRRIEGSKFAVHVRDDAPQIFASSEDPFMIRSNFNAHCNRECNNKEFLAPIDDNGEVMIDAIDLENVKTVYDLRSLECYSICKLVGCLNNCSDELKAENHCSVDKYNQQYFQTLLVEYRNCKEDQSSTLSNSTTTSVMNTTTENIQSTSAVPTSTMTTSDAQTEESTPIVTSRADITSDATPNLTTLPSVPTALATVQTKNTAVTRMYSTTSVYTLTHNDESTTRIDHTTAPLLTTDKSVTSVGDLSTAQSNPTLISETTTALIDEENTTHNKPITTESNTESSDTAMTTSDNSYETTASQNSNNTTAVVTTQSDDVQNSTEIIAKSSQALTSTPQEISTTKVATESVQPPTTLISTFETTLATQFTSPTQQPTTLNDLTTMESTTDQWTTKLATTTTTSERSHQNFSYLLTTTNDEITTSETYSRAPTSRSSSEENRTSMITTPEGTSTVKTLQQTSTTNYMSTLLSTSSPIQNTTSGTSINRPATNIPTTSTRSTGTSSTTFNSTTGFSGLSDKPSVTSTTASPEPEPQENATTDLANEQTTSRTTQRIEETTTIGRSSSTVDSTTKTTTMNTTANTGDFRRIIAEFSIPELSNQLLNELRININQTISNSSNEYGAIFNIFSAQDSRKLTGKVYKTRDVCGEREQFCKAFES